MHFYLQKDTALLLISKLSRHLCVTHNREIAFTNETGKTEIVYWVSNFRGCTSLNNPS